MDVFICKFFGVLEMCFSENKQCSAAADGFQEDWFYDIRHTPAPPK
jgi:hypothetical protein